jgi:hypothetical protein
VDSLAISILFLLVVLLPLFLLPHLLPLSAMAEVSVVALVRVELVAMLVDIALVAGGAYLRFVLAVSRVVEGRCHGGADCSIMMFLVVNVNPRTLA